ncbi:MAG: ABC transporter permease, partial [Rothia mucilaginosa]
MSLLENIVLAAPPLAAQPLVASPLAASDMHWEWVATNSQRILELTLSHLYQGVVPVA